MESNNIDMGVMKNLLSQAQQKTTDFGSLTAMLANPASLIAVFGAQIMPIVQEHPKILIPLLVAASLYKAQKSILDNVPCVRLTQADPLYDAVRRFILLRHLPRDLQLNWDAQSTEYYRTYTSADVSWPNDHKGSKDICSDYSGNSKRDRRVKDQSGEDKITLKAFALSREPIKALMQEAWDYFMSDEGHRMTSIYQVVGGGFWVVKGRSEARKLDSIHIGQEDKDSALQAITQYLDPERRAWYARQGIPYRQGFLFAGPPGTGKSSMALAIAGQFNLDFCSLSLLQPGLDDESLQGLIETLPSPCVLIIEDVDSAGLGREISGDGKKNKKSHKVGVTLSGLLNALDGAGAPQGHILILTTNAPENLDPALIREGRCDRTITFKLADHEIAKGIFKRMMNEPGVDAEYLEAKASEFAEQVPVGEFSPARIQVYLLDHINQVDSAVANVADWVVKMREQDSNLDEKRAAVRRRPAPEPFNPFGQQVRGLRKSRGAVHPKWGRRKGLFAPREEADDSGSEESGSDSETLRNPSGDEEDEVKDKDQDKYSVGNGEGAKALINGEFVDASTIDISDMPLDKPIQIIGTPDFSRFGADYEVVVVDATTN